MGLELIIKIVIFIFTIGITTAVSFFGLPIAVLFLVIAVLHYWQNGAGVFGGSDILILTIATFLAVFLDNIVLVLGLKKTDASRRGYIGALIGSFAGLFTGSLVGFVGFTTIGAVIGELMHGKNQKQAIKSGIGAAVSLLFGSLLRAIITLSIAAFVTYQLLF